MRGVSSVKKQISPLLKASERERNESIERDEFQREKTWAERERGSSTSSGHHF